MIEMAIRQMRSEAPGKMSAAGDTDARWEAVLARDARADGRFVYAVTSTGVFCKPSCASRRPRPERVRFFDVPSEAIDAGFRPCRRCRPLDRVDVWSAKIERACRAILEAESPPSLAALARQARTSRHHFLRRFKSIVGVTPREFASARRLEAVKRELRNGADVTTAMIGAGYSSSSRFYERDARLLAMTPTAYRQGGRGVAIRYAIASAPIGRLLVASTEAGVCAISLGDSDEQLVSALHAEYPRGEIVAAGSEMGDTIACVLTCFRDGAAARELPLDIRATAFQWQVWNALRAIPRGETRTYAEVAEAIGRPGAARAVARACASNRIALAIPCHRVVPAAGGPGGYRWGSRRKKALLTLETSGKG